MKKIWFFVEGDSEENFANNLIRRSYFGKAIISRDLLKFIEDTEDEDVNLCYVDNCGSVDRIPHEINENYYLTERTNVDFIFIVCDLERELCYINRRQKIIDVLNENVDQNKIKYVFSKSKIEAEYWHSKETIKRVLEIEYRKKFESHNIPPVNIPNEITNPMADLKQLFKAVDLKYREASFSSEFFSRVNFEESSSPAICRLINLLENSFQQ